MITDFEICDLGVMDVCAHPSFGQESDYEYARYGIGTDAESALDDLLEEMSQYHDVTGLEGRIKSEWDPGTEEGDNTDTLYFFGIMFNEDKGWV